MKALVVLAVEADAAWARKVKGTKEALANLSYVEIELSWAEKSFRAMEFRVLEDVSHGRYLIYSELDYSTANAMVVAANNHLFAHGHFTVERDADYLDPTSNAPGCSVFLYPGYKLSKKARAHVSQCLSDWEANYNEQNS